MYQRVLLAAALLAWCAGESPVHGHPEPVQALAAGDVILPCSFSITHDDFPTVEWSKEGLEPNIVFLYRDGCEIYDMKHPDFEYRTSLVGKKLKDGNFSLRISDVRLSDAGTYHCKRVWSKTQQETTTVELVVGAVSELKLSAVSAESGALTVQCEADRWPLEPRINFLDDRGNDIPADDPKRHKDASLCFTVTRTATLQDATHRVTCRVHQPESNQTRDTQILIPADCRRCSCLITGVTVGVTVLLVLLVLLAALCGVTLLCKRCDRCAEGQKLPVSRQSSDQSTLSSAPELQPFLKTDDKRSAAIEKLRREVDDLKSKLEEKERTIRHLQNELQSRLSSVVCHLGQPTIVDSPSKCSPDVLKPFSPPSAPGPEARNPPDDPSPKPTASTNSGPPKSGILPHIQGPKPGLSRQSSDLKPGRPIQRIRSSSSPAILNSATASGSSSASTPKKKLSRSISVPWALPDPNGPNRPKLKRRHSSVFTASQLASNRFRLLGELPEESEQLVH